MKVRLVTCGAVLLLALVPAGAAPARDAEPRRDLTFTLARGRDFHEFPLYYAGELVEGLPLVAVLRRDGVVEYVAFVYGDCTPAGDSGCAPPAEVQVWPACRRSLALYDGSAPAGPHVEQVTIRGVPAASLDEGTRLELQTGRSTVVVFADSRDRARRIADALRSLDGSAPPWSSLPPPAPGAREGTLEC